MRPRYLLGPLLALGVWGLAMLSAQAGTMLVGENWLGVRPVQQDLGAYGGTVYREYSQSATQDGEPQRIRLIRYPQTVTQVAVASMTTRGLWWELGNETNNADQDGGLTTDAAALVYTQWYHDTVAAIRAADPTAKILGPSVLGWTLYCCEPFLATGQRAYQRFVAAHQQLYGTLPMLDALTYHYYPATSYDLAYSEGELTHQFGMAADYAAAHGWRIAVTEWGHWSVQGDPACTSSGQTEAARSHYTRHGLSTFAARGSLLAVYFANVYPGCHNNGRTAYLFHPDGTLTVEGQAHRAFVQGMPSTLTPSPSPTATRVTCIPSFVRRCR